MRIAILGNAGSGKSTLAKALSANRALPVLDLDSVYWEPGAIAKPRPLLLCLGDVRRYCGVHDSWVIEGCYADVVEASFSWRPELLFLNPGLDVCLENCRRRPFESHKYRTKEYQDGMLDSLLKWVADYYERDGTMSLRGHMKLFERYDGPKRQITELKNA